MLSVTKTLNEPAAHACCVLLMRSRFEVSPPSRGLVLGLSIFFLVNRYFEVSRVYDFKSERCLKDQLLY